MFLLWGRELIRSQWSSGDINGAVFITISVFSEFGETVFGLTNITKLDISFCYNISDISFLGESSAQELNINTCSGITDITMLSSVQVLHISNCEQIKHFHGLRSLKDLTMLGEDFEILSGFETFSDLEKLSIAQVINHEQLLPYIQHLEYLKSYVLTFMPFFRYDFFCISRYRSFQIDFTSMSTGSGTLWSLWE
jgi:hypothetical protein